MDVKFEEAVYLKEGSYMMMDGVPSRIVKVEKSKTGKHGHSKCRIEAVGLVDNVKRIQVIVGHSKVEVPIIEKKSAQVLSVTGTKAQVMDAENYQTFDVDIPEEFQGKVAEGKEIVYWDVQGVKLLKQVK